MFFIFWGTMYGWHCCVEQHTFGAHLHAVCSSGCWGGLHTQRLSRIRSMQTVSADELSLVASQQQMIWIPFVQSFISIGDFLLAQPHEASPCPVCIVNGVAPPNHLRACWLWKAFQLTLISSLEATPQFCILTKFAIEQRQ